MRATYLSILASTILVSTITTFGQTAPPNDNFADRTVLTGTDITFSGTLAGATFESAETNGNPFPGVFFTHGEFVSALRAFGGVGSIWWTWTAPQSLHVTIQVLTEVPQSATAWVHVFSGSSITNLDELDTTSFGISGNYVSFDAPAGATYQIAVEGTFTQPVSLKLTEANGPAMLIQPRNCIVSPFGSAIFSAMASEFHYYYRVSSPTTSYQWNFNGVPIPSSPTPTNIPATNYGIYSFLIFNGYPSFVLNGVTTNQAGVYTVVASNSWGMVTSAPVTLTVIDTNPIPRLTVSKRNDPAQVPFTLTGEPGRWYKIESSSNLVDWINPTWLQITNTTTNIVLTSLGDAHFVRAALDVHRDICVTLLKEYRHAGYVFAISQNRGELNTLYTDGDIRTLVPLHPATGNLPFCPDGGIYNFNTVGTDPTCTYGSDPPGPYSGDRGHRIEP